MRSGGEYLEVADAGDGRLTGLSGFDPVYERLICSGEKSGEGVAVRVSRQDKRVVWGVL